MRRVRVQSGVREDPQHLLGEITKAASMVRAWRTATASGHFRYTASAGSVENSRGSRRAHGRLSSAAADGHVHWPRNATAFLQRVLECRNPMLRDVVVLFVFLHEDDGCVSRCRDAASRGHRRRNVRRNAWLFVNVMERRS